MLIDDLVQAYENSNHHWGKISKDEAYRYYLYITNNDSVLTYYYGNTLIGYLEYWILDFEQLGRLICYTDFNIYEEDIAYGPICYVSDIWSKDAIRNKGLFKTMKRDLLLKNPGQDFIVGESFRRQRHPCKVYNRDEATKRWMNNA